MFLIGLERVSIEVHRVAIYAPGLMLYGDERRITNAKINIEVASGPNVAADPINGISAVQR